jgi:hypothetical protein
MTLDSANDLLHVPVLFKTQNHYGINTCGAPRRETTAGERRVRASDAEGYS